MMRLISAALWTCLVALNAFGVGKSYPECAQENAEWCWTIANLSRRAVFIDCGEFAAWVPGNQSRSFQLSSRLLFGAKNQSPIKCWSDRSGGFEIVNPIFDYARGSVLLEITNNYLTATVRSKAGAQRVRNFSL